jgi:hypothetical protein
MMEGVTGHEPGASSGNAPEKRELLDNVPGGAGVLVR